jgi:hypothetical protein
VVVTIAEVLTPFEVSEEDFARELAHDLGATPDAAASGLTDEEQALLVQHGGIAGSTIRDAKSLGRTVLRAAASNLAKQTRTSISVPQAAELLHVDASRVRHRLGDRALYGFKIGSSIRLPLWQFEGGAPIPGLRSVLAALPSDLHPLEVAGFMTTADADLAIAEEPTSPRDWLIHGGDVGIVCELVAHLDTW